MDFIIIFRITDFMDEIFHKSYKVKEIKQKSKTKKSKQKSQNNKLEKTATSWIFSFIGPSGNQDITSSN